MRAEIIASGTELLLGEVADINSSFIAGQLAGLGIDLYYVSIVGDNYERFLGVLNQAFARSELVIVTGGLGPTKGDITRDVIAGLMGEKMVVDPGLKQVITDYFSKLHVEMPDNNLKQACLIPSASALPNPHGSAPGWWVERNGKIIISLPGPPGEMQPMWQSQAFPRLLKLTESVIVSRTLKTWGLSEAKIDQLVGTYMGLSNPTLALYAKPDGIQLRITAKAADRAGAARLIEEREKEIRAILGDYIWGADKETLDGLLSDLLLQRQLTIAAAESFTGGLLASTLAALPKSREFFRGGLTLYTEPLRAEFGITSGGSARYDENSAAGLAALACSKFRADIGIGIDGYLESIDGTTTGRSFIALCFAKGKRDIRLTYPAGAYQLVRRSVMQSLFSLRKELRSKGE
jgi:nicotinamide-nucleotide amidase